MGASSLKRRATYRLSTCAARLRRVGQTPGSGVGHFPWNGGSLSCGMVGHFPVEWGVHLPWNIHSSFDQSAGIKEFELGTNLQRVIITGSFHGVSGTYYCTPAASSTCAAQVAADGFTLGGTADTDNSFSAGGGTWTFKPTDPETRLMETPDGVYASYGWWLHKSEDGSTFTAPPCQCEVQHGL